MVLTVTLNAAVDRTYRVDGFRLDTVHRCHDVRVVAGGKGVNVARTISRLGGETAATGILAGHNGSIVADSLTQEGIPASFLWTEGESRTCIAVVDGQARTQTEVNESGPNIPASTADELEAHLRAMISDMPIDYVALCGSVPPGLPDDVYGPMIDAIWDSGARPVLDSSGEPLRKGYAAGPWMVKPNVLELQQLIGRNVETPCEAADAATGLLGGRVEVAAVTMGAMGCVVVDRSRRRWVPSPSVPFVSAVGSGDALLGAMLLTLERGNTWDEAARMGVAAGAANACVYGAGYISSEQVAQLYAQTDVIEV